MLSHLRLKVYHPHEYLLDSGTCSSRKMCHTKRLSAFDSTAEAKVAAFSATSDPGVVRDEARHELLAGLKK